VRRRGPLSGLGLAIVLALAGPAAGQVLAPQYPGGYKPQFDENKPLEEQKASLPAYPADENLIRFEVGPTSAFDFFVDAKSVSVEKDGVIRYTLVARSPSGALNVSYEGIRCESRERKLYAFGRSDKTWAPARSADWVGIPSGRTYPNSQQAVLADEFFCPAQGKVRSTEEAVTALKRGSKR
jgi:CNP1-like family protein